MKSTVMLLSLLVVVAGITHEGLANSCTAIADNTVVDAPATPITISMTQISNNLPCTHKKVYWYDYYRYKFYAIWTCTQCDTGARLSEQTYTISSGSATNTDNACQLNYSICVPCCSNCESTDWTTYISNIHETRTIGSCSACVSGATCTKITQYRCRTGYYGMNVASSPGTCKSCPANATCIAGDNYTFKCNEGYIKSGETCVANKCSSNQYGVPQDPGCFSCPSSATCDGSSWYQCPMGKWDLYTAGNGVHGCASCPSSDAYSDASLTIFATGTTIAPTATTLLPVSTCYLKGTPTKFYDTNGSFSYESSCFYSLD